MSRRRISVKELGQPDHQGWLYRKKESKGFLGMKWKKYWFVLKKTSFFWYSSQQVGQQPAPGWSEAEGDRLLLLRLTQQELVQCLPSSEVFTVGSEAVPVSR